LRTDRTEQDNNESRAIEYLQPDVLHMPQTWQRQPTWRIPCRWRPHCPDKHINQNETRRKSRRES